MHGQACPKDAARFPALQRALAHAVMDYIRSGAEPAERMIRHLVECELDYINCDHPEFIGSRAAIRQVVDERSMRAAAAGQHQGLIHREDSGGSSGPQQQQSSGKENASMASNGGTTNGVAGVGPSRGNKSSPVLAAAEGGSKDKPAALGQNSLGLKVRNESSDIAMSD